MSDMEKDKEDRRQFDRELGYTLGRLTGAVETMQSGLTAQLEDIRTRIETLQSSQDRRMDSIEAGLGKRIGDMETHLDGRITGLGNRVTTLENGEKTLIRDSTRAVVMAGGAAGALVSGAIALLK
jgi:chaperonin cofactor prefoldin